MWLADVFDKPAPLGAPALSETSDDNVGVDARVDEARRAQDRDVLTGLLGR